MTKPITELKAIAERAKANNETWNSETGAIQCFTEVYDEWYARGPRHKVVGFQSGKAVAEIDREFIATFDPPTVLALLARIENLEEALARVRSNASIPHWFISGFPYFWNLQRFCAR